MQLHSHIHKNKYLNNTLFKSSKCEQLCQFDDFIVGNIYLYINYTCTGFLNTDLVTHTHKYRYYLSLDQLYASVKG